MFTTTTKSWVVRTSWLPLLPKSRLQGSLFKQVTRSSQRIQKPPTIYLGELIAKLNDLFGSETSEQDQLRYVNGTILGKVAESTTLQQQAANNTKEQFASSPSLKIELQNAIIDSLDAHNAMSSKALNSTIVMDGLLDILLNHAGLYERLRSNAAGRGANS